jgi:cellulose synthase/poly-beta-1,6-N-acetylglucosamine synthase-like glycosyltransferase
VGKIAASIIMWFNYFVGAYYGVVNIIYTLILATSLIVIIRHIRRIKYSAMAEFMVSPETPPVTIIIPAFNERGQIIPTVESALSIDYPDFEVIVVNDGSDDGTIETLIGKFSLEKIDLIYRERIETEPVTGFYYNQAYPALLVIDKQRGGKADALNCGVNASRSPYYCTVDADSVLEKQALIRLVTPIMESTTPVIASGGVVRVKNGTTLDQGEVTHIDLPGESLATFQVVEYLRAFLFGRVGLDALNGLLILSGAFSLFNKSAVLSVGGYDRRNVTEDMELIVKLHKYCRDQDRDYKVKFISDPICWTEVPVTLKMLARQRRRWHLGLIETVMKYKRLLFNGKYGTLGTLVMPYYLLVELLSPIVEILGYVSIIIAAILGVLSLRFFLLFLVLAIFYGIFLSTSGVFLEEITYRRYPKWSHFFTLLLYGIIENLGYRQINSFFRVQAFFQYLRKKNEWEHVSHGRGTK